MVIETEVRSATLNTLFSVGATGQVSKTFEYGRQCDKRIIKIGGGRLLFKQPSRRWQQRALLSAHAASLAEFAVLLHHGALIDRTVDTPVISVKHWAGVQLHTF